MAASTQSEPKVRLSRDNMKAYLLLPRPELENHDLNYILAVLKTVGISYGVKQDKISQMVEQQIYDQEVLVAEGQMPEDGVDGYYEYKFDMNLDRKSTRLNSSHM